LLLEQKGSETALDPVMSGSHPVRLFTRLQGINWLTCSTHASDFTWEIKFCAGKSV